jgi:hypothetical protein
MCRLPLTLRALVVVPLFAVGVDLARATLACGPRAESCLEAAGRGWLGPAGAVLVLLYAFALALGVARLAQGGGRSEAVHGTAHPSLLRLWLVATLGVAAACAGQALIAGGLGDPATLGGGWTMLAGSCVVAGGIVALALRTAPAVASTMRALRPAAPRPHFAAVPVLLPRPTAPLRRSLAPLARRAAGRAPPTTAG